MSPRLRVRLLVAGVAAVAAGLTVGITALTSGHEGGGAVALKPRPGAPPLLLDLGVRLDPQARALRDAATLYNQGKRAAAREIFARYSTLDARVGLAFSRWPDGSLSAVQGLTASNPRSAFARLHLGLAYYWAGRGPDALAAWRAAVRVQPDSASAVHVDHLLHPNFAQGLPVFVPTFPVPPAIARLSPPRQLAALAAAARRPDAHAKILYGIALQRLESRFRPSVGTPPRRGGPSRRRGAGRRRGRSLLEGEACPGLLTSRPAEPAFPKGGNGALPPRAAPALVG